MPAVMYNSIKYSDTTTIRSVVLAHDTHEPRDVYTATRTGDDSVVTTRQLIVDGDIVIAGTVDGDTTRTDIYIAKDTSGYPIELTNITRVYDELGLEKLDISALLKIFRHTSLQRWMTDLTIPGLLPEGIGWDGVVTEYEKEKFRNVEAFFSGVNDEFMTSISKAVMFSPSNNILTDWNNAKVISSTDDLIFDTCDSAEKRFAIQWTEDSEFLKFEELKGFRSRRAYTGATSGAKKVLLGTVKRNAYGLILHWSLYLLRDK